ncbi:MAG TPA: tRNA uridine-5-carboxymethylaminomethyl(34) synthesis GTPase MnmE, partial [Stenomitos sp.]
QPMHLIDTIAAIATPPGVGGVGIIRLSGPDAMPMAQGLFRDWGMRPLDPPLPERTGRQVHVGHLVEPRTGETLDEIVMLVFRAPHSYTTEDVVELQCHAGPAVMQRILAVVLAQGARLAAAGEFTKRAFLGGRIDLTQAEAIAEISSARTERALSTAVGQLEGHLARATSALRAPVKHLLAELEASIDFPDEIDAPSTERMRETLDDLMRRASELLATAEGGRLLREGASLAIVGRPNVGKSSLLNALLQADRAIVTDVAGTTRDVLEAGLSIKGVPFQVLDTAGIRAEGADLVERIGIERSRAALKAADLRLVVLEAGTDPGSEDLAIWTAAQQAGPTLIVINKIDRCSVVEPLKGLPSGVQTVAISARTGTGLADLEQAIYDVAVGAALAPVQAVAINARHHAALLRAQESLGKAHESVAGGFAADFVAIDLRDAVEALGEITGEDLKEEVIDHIFASFCVGK